MNIPSLCRPLLVVASLAVLTFSSLAGAEPPMRAARLGYATGTVSFSPAGEDEWLRAAINRPLTTGDRLWADAGSRAEVQLGGASIRLGSATSVTLLNVDDRMAQFQLTEGTLKIRVRRMGPGEAFEVDTPNLAFYINRPGEYRIDVDANGDSTAVRVISGRAEAYGEGASYAVGSQQGYRFYGTGLSDYDRLAGAAWRDDDLDRWASERERRYVNSASARYVSLDVVGYEDLDSYGRWQRDPEYGQVWAPTRVSAGWAPFRDGHWSWVDPWGWTWVDDAPWGYAVSHYGRWANRRGTWIWVPGPQRERAVYAPAQVAFVGDFGGVSVGVGLGGLIGWFALAPREVYQPSYQVSRSYFDRINRSNAVVAQNNVTIVYNNYTSNRNTTNVTYANQHVRGGVVAVPATTFRQSQPVARASTPASGDAAAKGQVAHAAPVAPEKQSVQGGAPAASAQPTHRERRVVARTAPPPPPPAFAAQQQQLAARPGRPIDDAQRRVLKPAAAALAPAVAVVATAKPPAAAPPATAPAPRSPEARKADAARADSGRPEGGRGDGRRPDAAKADAGKGDAAKADAAKADAARADAAKADAARGEAAKADAARAEAARIEAAKTAASKADASRADAAKAEAARAESMKAQAARAAAARGDAAKADAARAEAAKAEAGRAAAARAQAAQAEAAKAQAAQAAAAKAEAGRAEAAKAQAAQAAAAKAEAGRAEAARAQAAQAAAARAQAAQAESAKAQAAQAAAAKAQAAQAEAAKAQAAQAAAARGQAAQAEAAKAQAAQAAAAKAAAAQAAAAKAATGAQGAAVKGEEEKAPRRTMFEGSKDEEKK